MGAGSRIRSYQYLPYLAAQNMNVTIAPLLDDEYLRGLYAGRGGRLRAGLRAYAGRLRALAGCRKFDLIWVEDEILPFAPAVVEGLLARLGVPYVVDYDDAVFHSYEHHRQPAVRALLGRKIDAVMRHARLVTVGNEYLAERAWRAGANAVAVLPTVVDLARYDAAPSSADGGFTIGWIGSPVTGKYLAMLTDALQTVCRRVPGARVILVGCRPESANFGPDVPVTVLPWSEASEADALRGFDVGIMPLPDSPWERGKCGYKLIQYMACGKPVVASPVGVNAQIVVPGENGFHATRTSEWINALTRLAADADLRPRLGAAGRARVEREYCLAVTAPRLAALLRAAAATGSKRVAPFLQTPAKT